ncbi:MAG: methyl-accepting chemotaxis protein, partial [Clostridiales Family XIII bacterium]|nr:methyl-accepting chemotaxis protein [Clostridiales Family XIII bacterium]
MRNLKIKLKLIIGFLVVAVLAAAVGIIGIWGMSRLDADSSKMYSSYTVAIDSIGDVRTNFVKQRLILREIAINSGVDGNKTELNNSINSLKSLEADMTQALAAYSAIIDDPGQEADFLEAKAAYETDFAQLKQDVQGMSDRSDREVWEYVSLKATIAQGIETDLINSADANMGWSKDYNDKISETYKTLRLVQILIMAIAVLVAVGLGIIIARMIATPAARLVEVANSMAKGDVDIDIDINSQDEIGALAKAFKSLAEAIREQARIMSLVAEGDYRASIRVRSDKDIMNRAINTVLDKNNKLLLEVKEASSQVSSGANQIATGAQSLASGATEQAATLQQFSASIADVLAQSEENTKKSQEAYDDVQLSSRYMFESMESMGNMTTAMQDINESASNIAKVIKVIDDIAFQTNILALNAAVEAARAGQHGKGFAVVADEVRNLASKSAEAAKETAALIESSTQKVSEGNSIAAKTSESLMSVNEISEKNAFTMQEISAASQRQSESISEITSGMGQISDVVQANSATAEQSAAAAEQLSAQASMLEEVLSQFKLRDGESGAFGFSQPSGDSYAGAPAYEDDEYQP